MKKVKKKNDIDYRLVESIVDLSRYYTSTDFPTKTIDGKLFIRVKRNINDSKYFYMLKDNMRYV